MAGTAVKRVAIIGAESTGKSWLTESLGQHYHCLWVPEFCREYLTNLNRPYTQADVEAIARGQIETEDRMAALTAGPYLFCDTNLLVIKIWMDSSYGHTPQWILDEIPRRQYTHHFLTDYDIPYQPDPLREHPELRDHYTRKYEEALTLFNIPYTKISGGMEERLVKCVEVLEGI